MPTADQLPTTANHPDVQSAKDRLREIEAKQRELDTRRDELNHQLNIAREKRLQADALHDEPSSEITGADRDARREEHRAKKAAIEEHSAEEDRLERKRNHAVKHLEAVRRQAGKEVKATLDAALAERADTLLGALKAALDAEDEVKEVYRKYDGREGPARSARGILQNRRLYFGDGDNEAKLLSTVVSDIESFVSSLKQSNSNE